MKIGKDVINKKTIPIRLISISFSSESFIKIGVVVFENSLSQKCRRKNEGNVKRNTAITSSFFTTEDLYIN